MNLLEERGETFSDPGFDKDLFNKIHKVKNTNEKLQNLVPCFYAIANALINGSGHSKINFVTAILDGIVLRIGYSVLFGLYLGMEAQGFSTRYYEA